VQPTVHVPDVVECVPHAHTQCTVPPTGSSTRFVPLTRSTKTSAARAHVDRRDGRVRRDRRRRAAAPVVGVIVGVIVAPPGVTVGVPGPGDGVTVTIGGR
jgi:hypothetical protein